MTPCRPHRVLCGVSALFSSVVRTDLTVRGDRSRLMTLGYIVATRAVLLCRGYYVQSYECLCLHGLLCSVGNLVSRV